MEFLDGFSPSAIWAPNFKGLGACVGVETVTESAQQVAFLRIAQRSASRAIHIHPDPSRSLFRLLRSRRAAIRNGASCATPLADLCPVRNAYPLETLPKELRPSRPQGVSPVFRTALRSVCADQGAFHSRCTPLQALGDSPPLALATPAGVGLGQGVVV